MFTIFSKKLGGQIRAFVVFLSGLWILIQQSWTELSNYGWAINVTKVLAIALVVIPALTYGTPIGDPPHAGVGPAVAPDGTNFPTD